MLHINNRYYIVSYHTRWQNVPLDVLKEESSGLKNFQFVEDLKYTKVRSLEKGEDSNKIKLGNRVDSEVGTMVFRIILYFNNIC